MQAFTYARQEMVKGRYREQGLEAIPGSETTNAMKLSRFARNDQGAMVCLSSRD
jgi:hypothetical protein